MARSLPYLLPLLISIWIIPSVSLMNAMPPLVANTFMSDVKYAGFPSSRLPHSIPLETAFSSSPNTLFKVPTDFPSLSFDQVSLTVVNVSDTGTFYYSLNEQKVSLTVNFPIDEKEPFLVSSGADGLNTSWIVNNGVCWEGIVHGPESSPVRHTSSFVSS